MNKNSIGAVVSIIILLMAFTIGLVMLLETSCPSKERVCGRFCRSGCETNFPEGLNVTLENGCEYVCLKEDLKVK